MTGPSGSRSERESPPTQMLLRPSHDRSDAEIDDLDLSKIDDDPITYFLTPAQRLYDDDDSDAMDFEMDFDAGIEDAKHPPPIVRSISPSSLGGLGLPPPRIPTPPSRSLSPDTDRDMPLTPDDHEDYMYLAGNGRANPFGLPFSLKDLAAGKLKTQEKGKKTTDGSLALSYPLPPGAAQERARTRSGRATRRGRPRTTAFRRSPHAWREPSPDVWSIEEEAEEELHSDAGDSAMEGDHNTEIGNSIKGIDIPAAKPRKRVRFVLPNEA
ncbi:hypothetical protein B0T16DRAFT_454161 [Cercophora newfieldiana]|uniref:Uncharacterized protein n=1 Tax=Cercophora newfieldiana TaxID=92897 RepID=A0AA39YHN5_9PEZI|nr:hypothetical protein B0T16DRAFT_454161 [Cercophora newfieldiana]